MVSYGKALPLVVSLGGMSGAHLAEPVADPQVKSHSVEPWLFPRLIIHHRRSSNMVNEEANIEQILSTLNLDHPEIPPTAQSLALQAAITTRQSVSQECYRLATALEHDATHTVNWTKVVTTEGEIVGAESGRYHRPRT